MQVFNSHILSSVLLFTIVFSSNSKAVVRSQLSDADVITAYIYQMSSRIEWAYYTSPDTFSIGIYGDDPVMLKSLKKLEKQNIKNKTVQIKQFNQLKDIEKTDMLYVNYSSNYDIERIFRLIKSTSTLLLTDRYENKREVMINFYHDDNKKILFEINSRNLEDENISISPKLLLLGGTELDIRKLYLETEKVLELEQTKVLQTQNQLKNKELELQELNRELQSLQTEILNKNKSIKEQQSQIDIQQEKLKTITDSLKNIVAKTHLQSLFLDSLNNSLAKGNREKESLDNQLSLKNAELEKVNTDLYILNKNISDQEKVLAQQFTEIKKLRLSRSIIFLSSVLFLILIITILIYYVTVKRKNKKIEQTLNQLKKAQDQLVESKKMASIGQLTAGIAHEINNPINYISSSIEGLNVIIEDIQQILNEFDQITIENVSEKLECIKTIKKKIDYDDLIIGFNDLLYNVKIGTDKTKDIVNSMRIFSHTGDSEFSKVDINKAIESTLVLIHNQLKDRIKVYKDYGNLPYIQGQSGALSQAFLNIIVNASQAIPKEGHIKICTSYHDDQDGSYVVIDIEDNGIGIPPEEHEKIYDPFFTTKQVGKGTGLGMYLSYNIIKKHQGTITFDSEVNKGTTFHITLPINQNNE